MTKRIAIKELEPEAYNDMMALEKYTATTQVDSRIKELIKIRASQINKCTYCIDMHTEDTIKLGENERRIFLLSAWQESHLFSEQERAVLQLTEEITNISNNGVSDATYNNIRNHFSENITAQIIMLIIVINSWNRIAISTRMIYKN